MVMSVGICECGCDEFNHEVGDASEEHEPDMDWERRGRPHAVVKQDLPHYDGSGSFVTLYKVVNGQGVSMGWKDTLAEAERVAALLSDPSLEEEPPPDYENWRQHQCTKQCTSPCLVARCRDSFDGDGFWVWCSNCDIQCPTSWATYSDEPQEDENDDTDEFEDEEPPEEYSEDASEQFTRRWTPVDIGTQIRVDFSEEIFVITDAVILNEYQDLARLSSLSVRPNNPQVQAFFTTGLDGFEILVHLSEIVGVA